MKITIFDYEFQCTKCGHEFKDTLEEETGFCFCPLCEYELEWQINIEYKES